MTIRELEMRAGVKDQTAFWPRFSHIRGTTDKDGKLRSNGLEWGIAELRRMAAENEDQR